jgi:hypothetical protein
MKKESNMRASQRILLPFVFTSLALLARAQSGTLDQVSPVSNAGFNGDAVSLTWQAQVHAGLTGQLEGFTLSLTGAQGATLGTAVRIGPGWNTTPTVFTATITKPTSGTDNVFVNVTSAGILVTPSTVFVIEMQGLGTGTGLGGSYVPPPGSPLYPDPLFLNGPGCFADCGWRIGFQTYVVQGGAALYCFGDGSGTACPCFPGVPAGAPGNGCPNSINAAGAHLSSSGNPSIASDTLELQGSGMPNSSALYFQGTTQSSLLFGDGLRCAGGQVIRLGTKANASGSSEYPDMGDPSVHVRGLCNAGDVRDYQCWYRNADPAFCTSSTFNLTNGVQLTWQL